MTSAYRVNPINSSNDEIVRIIRAIFGLNEYPYDNMDPDIIFLAFVPACEAIPDLIDRIGSKYGTCDHQTLEFYGDRILYGVVANITYDFFGLTMSPHFYSTLNSFLTKNRLFTDIMIDKKACELVRAPPFLIREGAKFHNMCADSFEALVGAIFIHLKKNKVDYMTHIKNWLLKNTGLPYVLKRYLDDNQFYGKAIYIVNNRETLRERWIKGYEDLARDLMIRRKFIDKNTYDYLMNLYTSSQNVSTEDFAFTAIIINPKASLEEIFSYLGWTYYGVVKNDTGYIVEGSPSGIPTIIGSGSSPEEATNNAINYLFSRGYVTLTRNISLRYSSAQPRRPSPKIKSGYLRSSGELHSI